MRVTMSAHTESEKPASVTPHRTIRTRSSPSSARHFRWRWRCSTNRPELSTGPSRYWIERISVFTLSACGPSSFASLSRYGSAIFWKPDLSTLSTTLTPIARIFASA